MDDGVNAILIQDGVERYAKRERRKLASTAPSRTVKGIEKTMTK